MLSFGIWGFPWQINSTTQQTENKFHLIDGADSLPSVFFSLSVWWWTYKHGQPSPLLSSSASAALQYLTESQVVCFLIKNKIQ